MEFCKANLSAMNVLAKFVLCFVVYLTLAVKPGSSHTMGMGTCPKVTPMNDFNMDKFMGVWYVIQKFSTSSSCMKYNFTKGDDGKMRLVQTRQHFILDTIGVDHIYTYTGVLTVPEPGMPSRMRVKFPLNVAGDSEFLIFTTDYNSYAGIFTCQKVLFANSKSSTILSRTPTLDEAIVNQIRQKLKEEGVDPEDFSVVDQSKCISNADATFNVKVDDKTFTSENLADTAKQVGSAIESGVEKAGAVLESGLARAVNMTSGMMNSANKDGDTENIIP